MEIIKVCRKLLILSILVLSESLISQNISEIENFDLSGYKIIANDSLEAWYNIDGRKYFNTPTLKEIQDEFKLVRDVYTLNELQTRSVPIIFFKENLKSFKRGQSLLEILDFIKIPNEQHVMISSKEDSVYITPIMISLEFPNDGKPLFFITSKEEISSIIGGHPSLIRRVLFDSPYFVFISPFGYCIIKDNQIYVITLDSYTDNNISYKIIEANYYINNILGRKAVNSIIKHGFLKIKRKSCKNKKTSKYNKIYTKQM